MLTHKVRTYAVQKEQPKMALYILNRGRKPLFEPCPNCFVLYVRDRDELETYYWTFYAFWQNGFFHPHLCGSVIEMLRLGDLKMLMRHFVQPAFEKACENPEMIEKIKATHALEKKIEEQAKALKELRNALVRRYYLTA